MNTDISSAQSNEEKYCPSDDWIYCGEENNHCYIEGTIKSTTVSFGANNNKVGSFVFWDLTNTESNTFIFTCEDGAFGDPFKGISKGCCYRNNQQVYNSSNDKAWTKIATYNEKFDTNGLAYVRYGDDGQYWYRWMDGPFQCNTNYFPWIGSLNDEYITCSKYNNVNQTVYSQSTFVNCGATNNGGSCDTHIVPNGDSLSLIQFGDGSNTKDEWLYTYAYNSNQEIACNQDLFRDFDGQFCGIHNGTVFPSGVVGSWQLVDSCSGCPSISESIQQGQTSTSSESTTTEWSESLAYTVKEGIIFESDELTTTVSTSVSNTVSSSYSQSVSKTCSATCGNNTKADWKIWQWQMNAQEYQGADTSPFTIYACYYECNTEINAPRCPPNYCADFACQTCKPYS